MCLTVLLKISGHRHCGSYVISAVCLSVVLSVSRITAKIICRFNWKLMLWLDLPITSKNLLTFGGYRVLDTESRSLFYFPHYCRIGDLLACVKLSVPVKNYTVVNFMLVAVADSMWQPHWAPSRVSQVFLPPWKYSPVKSYPPRNLCLWRLHQLWSDRHNSRSQGCHKYFLLVKTAPALLKNYLTLKFMLPVVAATSGVP